MALNHVCPRDMIATYRDLYPAKLRTRKKGSEFEEEEEEYPGVNLDGW